jgi:catechol 2,3-dioxygenase-like lactoylglutathione lyase family enzyme
MDTQGFNHIHLHVRNLEASLRFYAAFGFVKAAERGDHSNLVRPGESDIITLRVSNMHGVDHFGFMLRDASQLDAAIRELEAVGGRLIERTVLEPVGTPTAFLLDPDGYHVQI